MPRYRQDGHGYEATSAHQQAINGGNNNNDSYFDNAMPVEEDIFDFEQSLAGRSHEDYPLTTTAESAVSTNHYGSPQQSMISGTNNNGTLYLGTASIYVNSDLTYGNHPVSYVDPQGHIYDGQPSEPRTYATTQMYPGPPLDVSNIPQNYGTTQWNTDSLPNHDETLQSYTNAFPEYNNSYSAINYTPQIEGGASQSSSNASKNYSDGSESRMSWVSQNRRNLSRTYHDNSYGSINTPYDNQSMSTIASPDQSLLTHHPGYSTAISTTFQHVPQSTASLPSIASSPEMVRAESSEHRIIPGHEFAWMDDNGLTCECGRPYTGARKNAKSNWKRHLKSLVTVIDCNHCGRSTNRGDNFQTHMQTHHPEYR